MALKFIKGLSDFGASSFYEHPFIKECLKRNRDLALIQPAKTFATIGAGSIPSTILKAWDYKLFESYLAFDIDPEAAELGQEVLKLCGIPGEYKVCDGGEVDFTNIDIVFIANLVQGKRHVLEKCYETAPSQVQVILRATNDESLGLDNFSVDDIDSNKWKVKGIGEASEEFSSFNIFLQKIS